MFMVEGERGRGKPFDIPGAWVAYFGRLVGCSFLILLRGIALRGLLLRVVGDFSCDEFYYLEDSCFTEVLGGW